MDWSTFDIGQIVSVLVMLTGFYLARQSRMSSFIEAANTIVQMTRAELEKCGKEKTAQFGYYNYLLEGTAILEAQLRAKNTKPKFTPVTFREFMEEGVGQKQKTKPRK